MSTALVLVDGETNVAAQVDALQWQADETYAVNRGVKWGAFAWDHAVVNDWQALHEYGEELCAGARFIWSQKTGATQFPWAAMTPPSVLPMGSSGHTAINLAMHHGHTEIWLYGFTLTGEHTYPHVGKCVAPRKERKTIDRWVRDHRKIAAEAERRGIKIINLTPDPNPELPYPTPDLQEVIDGFQGTADSPQG